MIFDSNTSDASFIYTDSSASNLQHVMDTAEKANLGDIMKNSVLVTRIIIHDSVNVTEPSLELKN